MRIVIFGAEHIVGQLVVEKALQMGHEVVAFVSNNKTLNMNHRNLKVTRGSLTNKDEVKASMHNADAVISTLKPKFSLARSIKDLPVAKAHKVIMESMEELSITRFITLGNTAISAKEDVHQIVTVIPRKITKLLFPTAYYEMKEINRLLQNSNLDWTVVRATKTNKSSTTGYKLSFGDTLGEVSVSYENVAQCLIDAIGKKVWYKKMPIVFNQR